MKETLIVGSLVVLAILVISVVAQEMFPKIGIVEEVEKVRQQVREEIGAISPEEVAEHIKGRMLEGELKLNFTPYLRGMPVFPPIKCPPFMVVELPYKPYVAQTHHYVMKYLHEQNLTLPLVCKDKAKVESLVREAVEKIDLGKVCGALEDASKHCREFSLVPCEKISEALPLCVEGLKKCKQAEQKVKVAEEAWKERLEKVEENLTAQEEAIKELWEEKSPKTKVKVEIPKIVGIIPKCYVEERICERLKERLEKCEEFQAKCAPRCDVVERLALECKATLADKEALITKVVGFIWKRCELINYYVDEAEVEEAEKEVIPPAEIQPVIIVTKALTPDQEAQIRALVERLEQVYKDETWIYRAFVRANKIEDLRELGFVLTVELDHVLRALQKRTFKELPELPEFAPPVAKILPHLEGVKAKVETELRPVITEAEVEILNSSQALIKHNKEERARGIGYAILKFLGLQAGREREDAKFLDEKAKYLSEVAKSLKAVAETEKKPEVKVLILEKIAELQKTLDILTKKAAEKRRMAFGLWSWLGLR